MEMNIDDRLTGTRGRQPDETDEQYAVHAGWQKNRSRKQAARLRTLLDLIEQAGLVMPDITCWDFSDGVDAIWGCPDSDAFRTVVKAVGSTVDSPWTKLTYSGKYAVEREVDGIGFSVRALWGACTQVQVGTKTETVTEVVTPAQTRQVVSEVPVMEWRCPDSFLQAELDAATGHFAPEVEA